MLYTDTDLFFLHFFVDNLAKEINARLQLRDAFDFSEIEHTNLSMLHGQGTDVQGGEVSYFKDETKGDPIVEFDALRQKMYSFTVCRATEYTQCLNCEVEMRHKNVTKRYLLLSNKAIKE